MKRNKFAAGALALALGLGAVAPAYADVKVTEKEYVYDTEDAENGVGEYGITEDYREAEDKYVEAWNKLAEAEAALEEAKENEATAKAAYEAALKALNDFEAVYGDNGSYITTLERYKKERFRHIDTYHAAGGQTGAADLAKIVADDVDTIGEHVTEVSTDDGIIDKTKAETQAEAVKDIVALNQRIKEFTKTDEWIQNKRANLQAELTRRQGDYNEAQNARQAAKKAYKAAKAKYDAAKIVFIGEGASRVTIRKAEEAGDVKIVIKERVTTEEKPVTETEETTETEVEVSNDGEGSDDDADEITDETRAELEKAIADSKVQIEAVRFLKENTPKTIEKVADKLDKLVKEAKATIKLSEELLGKKSAFNFVSTAYAAEEKSKEERAKELRDKLNANTQEIKDTLKENEASLVEEEEAEEEETPAPAPEKEDDKDDADKGEDKDNADDKGEDKDNADKGEDKDNADDKGEDKDDADDKGKDKKDGDKKVEKTTKVVKKAGKNAKTGIAGVAGVAGVLAAASVAYAASKKNN